MTSEPVDGMRFLGFVKIACDKKWNLRGISSLLPRKDPTSGTQTYGPKTDRRFARRASDNHKRNQIHASILRYNTAGWNERVSISFCEGRFCDWFDKVMPGAAIFQRVRRGVLNRISRHRAVRLHHFNDNPAVLTLSFDDVPRSAITQGLPILQAHDVSATFYVCGAFSENRDGADYASSSDLQALSQQGHEVGCHGFAHLDYQLAGVTELLNDLDHNAEYFASIGLPSARTFAYPYGRATPRAKTVCGGRFEICRGVYPDLAGEAADLNILPSVELYASSLTPKMIDHWIHRLSEKGGVLSLFSHGVTPDPGPYDCTPEQLDYVLRLAKQKGVVVKKMQDLLETKSH